MIGGVRRRRQQPYGCSQYQPRSHWGSSRLWSCSGITIERARRVGRRATARAPTDGEWWRYGVRLRNSDRVARAHVLEERALLRPELAPRLQRARATFQEAAGGADAAPRLER